MTLRFAAIALPVGLVLPFAMAMLLNSKSLRGSRYFQALFFMPYIIPFVAALFAWGSMLNPEQGWLNGMLGFFGVEGPDWLNDPIWIYPAPGGHRPVGHRQRDHHQPGRAPERADRAVRRGRASTAPASGASCAT